LAVAVVIIAFASFASQEAFAYITIQDEASCEGAPFGGTWDGGVRSCTVDGFINSDAVVVNSGITLVNTGVINSSSNYFILNAGILNNTATGVINSDGLVNDNLIINSGAIAINGYALENDEGTIDNEGTISIAASGRIDNDKGIVKNYGTINNYGKITNENESEFDNYGDISNYGVISNEDESEIDNFLSGTIDNLGTIDIYYDEIDNYGTINNNGTLNNLAGQIFQSGTINNNGIMNNNGNIVMGVGTINNNGTIKNNTIKIPYGNYGNIILFGDGGFINNNGMISNGTIKSAGGVINVQCGGTFVDTVLTGDAPIDACAPVANSQSISANKGSSVAITLDGTNLDTYPNFAALPLQFSVASGPSNGALVGSNSSWTYTPGSDFSGSDSFTFVASDGTNSSTAATVSITVSG
jgi:hypothetical protein